MELLSMKCPNCAGNINYKHGKTSCKGPYCDSVIKISMSAEDLDYEQMMKDSAAAENAKKTYLAKLKRWQTIKYVSMVLCVVIGFVFGFTLSCVMSASKNADEQAQKRIEERENKK